MKFKFTLTLVALLCFTMVMAQKTKPSKQQKLPIERFEEDGNLSVEFDMKESEGGYKTTYLGSDGLVVYYDTKDGKKNVGSYEFIKFDKDLNQEYTISYTLPEKVKIVKIVENDRKIYFLTAISKSSIGGTFIEKYSLVRFDPAEKNFTTFDGSFPVGGAYLKDIKVVNDVAYMSVSKGHSPTKMSLYTCLNMCTCFIPYMTGLTRMDKQIAEFVVHNMRNKSQKVSQFGYDKRKGVVVTPSYSVDDSTGIATLLMYNKHKKLQTLWVKEIDEKGKYTKDLNIKLPADKEISDVRVTTVDDKKFFYGQYSAVNPRVKVSFGNSPASPQFMGVTFGVIGKNGIEKSNFIPFNKIKGFKAPLSTSETRQLKKAAKKGKDVGINLMVHFGAPLLYNDEIIIVGEVYYATYRTETYTTYSNGRATTSTRTVFDGYAFSNILTLSFDTKGELLWTNSIPYSRNKSYVITDRVRSILQEDGAVQIVYNSGYDLYSTLIDGEKVIDTKKIAIGATKKGDKWTKTYGLSGEVEYWYDDFYVASGVLNIKNKQLKGKDKKREVYYLRKVEVSTE